MAGGAPQEIQMTYQRTLVNGTDESMPKPLRRKLHVYVTARPGAIVAGCAMSARGKIHAAGWPIFRRSRKVDTVRSVPFSGPFERRL